MYDDKLLYDCNSETNISDKQKTIVGKKFHKISLGSKFLTKFQFVNCIFYECDFSNIELFHNSFVNCNITSCKFGNILAYDNKFLYCSLSYNEFENVQIIDKADPFILCNIYPSNKGILSGINDSTLNGREISAWKKCFVPDQRFIREPVIVELKIPADAARIRPYGQNKWRAEYALVVDAPEGAHSWYSNHIVYKTGSIVKTQEPFDNNPWEVCSSGIHFFLTLQEAMDYDFT